MVTRSKLSEQRERAALLVLTFTTSALCYSWLHGLIFGGLLGCWLLLARFAPATLPKA